MSKHVAKHRATPHRANLAKAPRKAIRTTLLLSTIAVATTGATVAGGVLGDRGPDVANKAAADANSATDRSERQSAAADLGDRLPSVSRNDTRERQDPAKAAALDAGAAGGAVTRTESLSDDDPRDIARALLGEFGFSADQFGCLDSLWTRESNWNPLAHNPSSGAHGIPQSLPGSKMASVGDDWYSNPVTQIRWGLGYIQDRYGSPCGAWSHSEARGWY